MGVYCVVHSAEGVSNESLHAREQVPHEADALVLVILVQVSLKIVDTELVRILKFAVVIRIDLHSIVGQMNVPI